MNKDLKQVLWKYSCFIKLEVGEFPHLMHQYEKKILTVTDFKHRTAEWKGGKQGKINSNGKEIPIVELAN